MTEERKTGVKLPAPDRVGIVVKDVDKAIDFYSSAFGWGPFQVLEAELEGFSYRGQRGSCRLKLAKLALARSVPIEIVLIQVLEGETPHTEFLRGKGEGMHHLTFRVDNLEDMLATLAKEGIEPVFSSNTSRAAFAYLNSDKIGGVMFELLQMK